MTDVTAGRTAGAEQAGEQKAAGLRAGMVADLAAAGWLREPWRPAFELVARHRYLPDTIWEHDDDATGPDYVPLRRVDDPGRWLAACYADAPVVTQVDDGHPGVDGRGQEVTSSASMPAVVADMLAALDAEPGMRVCEIGTGTGWNAGLLAHRLGPENVVSVEVDAELADAARTRLRDGGFGAVTVITAPDVAEAAERGPFDRLVATVAPRAVPREWMACVRPGGVAVVPWGTAWYPSALVRLDVGAGGAARGRIVGDASFMQLRGQRSGRVRLTAERTAQYPAVATTSELHPWHVKIDPHAATAIGLRLPDVRGWYRDDTATDGVLTVVDRAGPSWARLHLTDTPPYTVEEGGPRRLWDEVEAAYRWWRDAGEPDRGRWTITVGEGGQDVTLDP